MVRLILFLMVSVMAAGGTSMAENASICSVDTVPIQILMGGRGSAVTTFSRTGIRSGQSNFDTFVAQVTEHLVVRLAQENLCLNNTESQKRSLIQFAHMFLVIADEHLDISREVLRPLETQPSDVCRIYSPWIDIAIEREPVPSVRAIVRFSERQLLADQAMMDGTQNVPLGAAIPMTYEEYDRYFSAFKSSDLYHNMEHYDGPKIKNSEKVIPPDFLWFLTHTIFDDFPGSIYPTMIYVENRSTEGYTKIVTGLIDQCLASDGVNIQYNSVLDIPDLVPLNQYKIDKPFLR